MHILKRFIIIMMFITVAGTAADVWADSPPICIDEETAQIDVAFKGNIQVVKRYEELDPSLLRQRKDFTSEAEFEVYRNEMRINEARGKNYYFYEFSNFDIPVMHNVLLKDGSFLEDVYVIRDDQGKLKLLGETHEYGMIQCLNRLHNERRNSAPPR